MSVKQYNVQLTVTVQIAFMGESQADVEKAAEYISVRLKAEYFSKRLVSCVSEVEVSDVNCTED